MLKVNTYDVLTFCHKYLFVRSKCLCQGSHPNIFHDQETLYLFKYTDEDIICLSPMRYIFCKRSHTVSLRSHKAFNRRIVEHFAMDFLKIN